MNQDAKTIGAPAPPTREALLIEHTIARRRRDAAPLGSEAYQAALVEISRIEVAIAAVEVVKPGEPPLAAAPGARPGKARTGTAHS
jgi:hypothetical protein